MDKNADEDGLKMLDSFQESSDCNGGTLTWNPDTQEIIVPILPDGSRRFQGDKSISVRTEAPGITVGHPHYPEQVGFPFKLIVRVPWGLYASDLVGHEEVPQRSIIRKDSATEKVYLISLLVQTQGESFHQTVSFRVIYQDLKMF